MHRRQFLASTAGLALGSLAAPAIAQAKTKVRVGYLHTVAVDGQIWTGVDKGMFDKQGLDSVGVRIEREFVPHGIGEECGPLWRIPCAEAGGNREAP